MWRKENTFALLVGMQIDTTNMEKYSAGLITKLCLAFATPWTGVHPVFLSMGSSRQEYWSELPLPSQDPGIKPGSPALQADSLPTELQGKPLLSWRSIEIPLKTRNKTNI